MPDFATERCSNQFAWLKSLSFFEPEPRKGGQGTVGSLRRFFGYFLSLFERKYPVGDWTR